jgi:hypothetical protein
LSFKNKKQRRDYYCQVNYVAVEGPVTKTKWSHIPVTFSQDNIKLVSFPHTDAMVMIAHINKWDVMRVLVDNGSQTEVLLLSTFQQMGFDRKQLKEAPKPLYGFGGRKIEPIGSVSLSVSFGSLHNTRTKYITFDVFEMNYPYNAIFRRGLLNTFEATLHSLYLCLKVPAALEVISIHDSQNDARNIEQGFAPGHKNINCLQDENTDNGSTDIERKSDDGFPSRPVEPEGKTKRAP